MPKEVVAATLNKFLNSVDPLAREETFLASCLSFFVREFKLQNAAFLGERPIYYDSGKTVDNEKVLCEKVKEKRKPTSLRVHSCQAGKGIKVITGFPVSDRVLCLYSRESLASVKKVILPLTSTIERFLSYSERYAYSKRFATTDRLTGLYNKAYFCGILRSELKRASQLKKPIGLLFFDLDNFKHFNDTKGHQAGDDLLRRVAAILRASIGKADHAGRYGGEEFCVILPGATPKATWYVGEKVRAAVEKEFRGAVTVSVGGVSCLKAGQTNFRSLIKEADKALYRAKKSGKNRVELAIKAPIF